MKDMERKWQKKKGLFQTIVKVLKTGIYLACKLKNVIMSFLGGKKVKIVKIIKKKKMFIELDINRTTRIGRKRLFMMLRTKAGRVQLKRWLIGSIVNAAKAVGGAIASGAKAVGGAIVKGVKAVGNFVLKGASAIFNGVVKSVQQVWKWFKSLFKSHLFKEIQEFVICLIKGLSAMKNVVKAIQSFIRAIQTLLEGWEGFIKTLVNTICNFDQFAKAVSYLITGVEKSGKTRWLYFGRFLGRMVLAIGGLRVKDDPNFKKKHDDPKEDDDEDDKEKKEKEKEEKEEKLKKEKEEKVCTKPKPAKKGGKCEVKLFDNDYAGSRDDKVYECKLKKNKCSLEEEVNYDLEDDVRKVSVKNCDCQVKFLNGDKKVVKEWSMGDGQEQKTEDLTLYYIKFECETKDDKKAMETYKKCKADKLKKINGPDANDKQKMEKFIEIHRN